MSNNHKYRILFLLLFFTFTAFFALSQEPLIIDRNYLSVKIKLVYDNNVVMDYLIQNDLMLNLLISVMEESEPVDPSVGTLIQEGVYTITFLYSDKQESFSCYLNFLFIRESDCSSYYSRTEDIVNILRKFLISYLIENKIIK